MRPLESPWREWIWGVDDNFIEHTRLRAQCLAGEESRRKCLAIDDTPETEAALRELAEMLANHMIEHFPQHFQLQNAEQELLEVPKQQVINIDESPVPHPLSLLANYHALFPDHLVSCGADEWRVQCRCPLGTGL